MNLKYSLCGNWLTEGLLCCTFTFFSQVKSGFSSHKLRCSRRPITLNKCPIIQLRTSHMYICPPLPFSQGCLRPRATPGRGGRGAPENRRRAQRSGKQTDRRGWRCRCLAFSWKRRSGSPAKSIFQGNAVYCYNLLAVSSSLKPKWASGANQK